MFRITATALLLLLAFLPSVSGQSRATYAGDDLRTGWYSDQALLNPGTVSSSSFGKLFDTAITGQVYAQPLVSNNILFIATEQNWIYGLDPLYGGIKWSRNVGQPWNIADIGCPDLAPNIGVTGTPVIDSASGTAYFLKKTYVSGNSGPGAYWMHAIDVATGAEKSNFPVQISGTAQNDSTSTFEGTKLLNRTALLLMNGVVYAGFGAMCDRSPYKGWVVGVSTSGEIKALWTSVPGSNDGGGIWQSGGGLVSDGPGRIFFSTGNGYNSTPNGVFASTQVPSMVAESLVRLAVQADGSLKPDNFFTPYDAVQLDDWDADLASGAPTALPAPWFGTPAIPKLMVIAGKEGYVYLLNRDDLGGQRMGSGGADGVVARIGPYGGVWSRPAIWAGDGGYIYMPTGSAGSSAAPTSGLLRAYQYGLDGAGKPSLSLAASSTEQLGGNSSSPIVTSDGTTSGSALVWIIRVPDSTGVGAQLCAYDAVPDAGRLTLRFSAPVGTATKFTPPGVGPARLYVGTRDGHLLGFGVPAAAALTAPLTNFGAVTIGQSSTAHVTLTANKSVTIESVSTTDPQFQIGAPTLPASLTASQTFQVPVTFKPAANTLVSGALHVVTDLGPLDFSLSGLGQDAGAHLQASPAALSLGGTSVGGTLIGTVTFSNTGAQPLTINDVLSPAAPFAISGAPPSNTQIAPGQSIKITVQFSPNAIGSFTDKIEVVTTAGNAVVNLSGSATLPGALSISPLNLDFGTISVNASAVLSFTIANTGSSSLVVTKSKPPILGQFSAVDTLDEGIVLAPGASKTVAVRFSAAAAGTFTDSWTINSDAPTGLKTLTFTGTAVVSSGSISSVAASSPASVVLSDNDIVDWVHWGLGGPQGVNRMAGVSPQISDFSVVGGASVYGFSDDPTSFSWTGGSPAAASSGTPSGVYVWGQNAGFRLTAPADTSVRVLNLYVGLWQAQGRLVATLSDGSAPDLVDTSLNNPTGTSVRTYTLTYKASSPGQTLTVTWTMNSGTGNVTLSAASLLCRNGSLAAVGDSLNAPVNLTTEGTLDWVQWGDSLPNRKAGVQPQLSSYVVVGGGPVYNYANDPRPVGWLDGSPAAAGDGDLNGIFIWGSGNGFSFTAPADKMTRTLVVHVGGWNSSGTLTAHLSDGSAADFVETTQLVDGQYDGNYTLTYHAGSDAQTLTIEWIMSSGDGNVTLNAAALGCGALQNGCLAGYGNSSTTPVDLTAEGGADWVHWGDVTDRKGGVTAQLSEYTVVGAGAVYNYANDLRPAAWTDGAQVTASDDNLKGVYIWGSGNGFSLCAPADASTRTLTIHVGGWYSAGKLTAQMSDGSAIPFIDTTPYVAGQYDRNYTLVYRALTPGQKLTVSWVMTDGEGNVTLNAAAVSNPSAAPTGSTLQTTAGLNAQDAADWID